MNVARVFDLGAEIGFHGGQPVYGAVVDRTALAAGNGPFDPGAEQPTDDTWGFDGVLIAIHGRGATAHDAIGFGCELAARMVTRVAAVPGERGRDGAGVRAQTGSAVTRTDAPVSAGRLLVLAPQAADRSWYPQRFLVPRGANQPQLDSALAAVRFLVAHAVERGIAAERVLVAGFSQGACLALQSLVELGAAFGSVFAFSGGLIGTDEEIAADFPRHIPPVPVFIGCGDTDFHIPVERVQLSAQTLHGAGAAVDARIYPNLPHTIVDDELDRCAEIGATALYGRH